MLIGNTKTNPTVVHNWCKCMCNHVYSVAWLIKVVCGMQSVTCVNMLQHVTVVTHRFLQHSRDGRHAHKNGRPVRQQDGTAPKVSCSRAYSFTDWTVRVVLVPANGGEVDESKGRTGAKSSLGHLLWNSTKYVFTLLDGSFQLDVVCFVVFLISRYSIDSYS